jgi:hypothetical protein
VELQERLGAKNHAGGRPRGDHHALALDPYEVQLMEKILPGGTLLPERTQRLHQQLEDLPQLGRKGSKALMDDQYRHR